MHTPVSRPAVSEDQDTGRPGPSGTRIDIIVRHGGQDMRAPTGVAHYRELPDAQRIGDAGYVSGR
jgi:hypothetical protein